MAAAYPSELRSFLQLSKARTQPARFTTTDPRRGALYVQPAGTVPPVIWQVDFRFRRADAIRFRLWYETVINFGIDEFELGIDTELGCINHVCRFLPDSLMDTRQESGAFSFSAQIYAKALITPQEWTDAAAVIVALPDWDYYVNLLDIAINQNYPEE